MTSRIQPIAPDRADEIVSVLAEAFSDYPVMRHVVGSGWVDYESRLETLIGLFVAARMLRNEPAIGIADGGTLVAVATMTPPGKRPAPEEFLERREAIWEVLGREARDRYDRLGEIWQQFEVAAPHLHLNMIGVRRAHAGKGLGRRLLDRVHELSVADVASTGVSLSTENPANVPMYRHVGYDLVGHVRIASNLETWGFFRPDSTSTHTGNDR